jgi:hypothetical protein
MRFAEEPTQLADFTDLELAADAGSRRAGLDLTQDIEAP